MNYKEDIEKLLTLLKKEGFDRARIEKELNYSENYIDQTLARGGNKRFLEALKKFRGNILQKTTPSNSGMAINSDKESMAIEIIHLKAVVKAQGELLVKMAAVYYGRPVQEVMKELRDNTSLIIMDQDGS